MFKNFFKNKSNMTTENTEFDQEIDDVTLENNANGEQLIIEELSVEEQLTQDLAKEKDKFLRLFFKIWFFAMWNHVVIMVWSDSFA